MTSVAQTFCLGNEFCSNFVASTVLEESPSKTQKKRGKFYYLQFELLFLQLSFFAYSPLRRLLDALSHCKQTARTVSKKTKIVSEKKTPIVSKKAKIINCK